MKNLPKKNDQVIQNCQLETSENLLELFSKLSEDSAWDKEVLESHLTPTLSQLDFQFLTQKDHESVSGSPDSFKKERKLLQLTILFHLSYLPADYNELLELRCQKLNLVDALIMDNSELGGSMKEYSEMITYFILKNVLKLNASQLNILFAHVILQPFETTTNRNHSSPKKYLHKEGAEGWRRKRKLNQRLFMPLLDNSPNKKEKKENTTGNLKLNTFSQELEKVFPDNKENIFLDYSSLNATSSRRSVGPFKSFSCSYLNPDDKKETRFNRASKDPFSTGLGGLKNSISFTRQLGGLNGMWTLDKPLMELETRNSEQEKCNDGYQLENAKELQLQATHTIKRNSPRLTKSATFTCILETPTKSSKTTLPRTTCDSNGEEEVVIVETPKKLIKCKKVLF